MTAERRRKLNLKKSVDKKTLASARENNNWLRNKSFKKSADSGSCLHFFTSISGFRLDGFMVFDVVLAVAVVLF